MTEDKIAPALTPEEWREGEFDSFYGKATTSAHRDHKGRWFFHSEMEGREDHIVILNQADDNGRASHKLAALALHGQPFGFTREDVRKLEEMAQEVWRPEWYLSLAARIEAILPPEGQ